MPLYAYLTPKVDFKCKFNHHQSFLYEWQLTAQTISNFELDVRFEIESNHEASQVPNNIACLMVTGVIYSYRTDANKSGDSGYDVGSPSAAT